MKQYKNRHYNIEEKRTLLKRHCWLSKLDVQSIAEICDYLCFDSLKDLAKTINVFAKGVKR